MTGIPSAIVPVAATDGRRWELLAAGPANLPSCVLWLPDPGRVFQHLVG